MNGSKAKLELYHYINSVCAQMGAARISQILYRVFFGRSNYGFAADLPRANSI